MNHCPGKRTVTGQTLGMCIACALREGAGPRIEPPAERILGVWTCSARIDGSALKG